MNNTFNKISDTEKLELIFSYIHKLNDTRDIELSLITLANMGRDIVNAERCTIWLLDETGEKLFSRVAHGVKLLEVNAKEGIVGECIQTGKALVINDPYNDDRFNSEVDVKTGFLTKSIIVHPLYNSKQEIMGAIQALNKVSDDSKFTKDDERILSIAGTFSSKILDTLKLHLELINSQKETITLLGELCEKRSLETGKHTARVSLYSKVIAKKLKLSEQEITIIASAAALHDIGKLNVPDKILLKPGKLDRDEYRIIQTHAEIGYKMLKKSKGELLKLAGIIAREHHEKYDGTGYPRRLEGEEIHIFARIVALADVFDAISSRRCYKEAWEFDKAFSVVEEERGKHFDPKVVDAFLQSKDEVKKIYEIYKEV